MTPTPRELEVLQRLAQPGATVRSVAHELGISENAAKARLQSLYRRLGVRSALQAHAQLESTVRAYPKDM